MDKIPEWVRVSVDYQAPYADPIVARAGDEVTVDLERKTDIPGWVWCTNRNHKSGWVPIAYLESHAGLSFLRVDYDAIELTIHVGEILRVDKQESSFFWVTNPGGDQGWIPVENVVPVDPEQVG
jgi:uncharacterized protein YgiM (DUF1202 family)